MKRSLRLVVLLTALSACATQAPQLAVLQTDTPPFRAIPPTGYCMTDNSDPLASGFSRTREQVSQLGGRVLAVFRPCDEPIPERDPTKRWHGTRLMFSVKPVPSAMTRQAYLAGIANPKQIEFANKSVVPTLRKSTQDAISSSTVISDWLPLGSDTDAVYAGFDVVTHGPPTGMTLTTRSISADTLIGAYALNVTVLDLTLNLPPKDWDTLREIAARAIRNTIAAAERPASGSPAPVPPATAPQTTGLST